MVLCADICSPLARQFGGRNFLEANFFFIYPFILVPPKKKTRTNKCPPSYPFGVFGRSLIKAQRMASIGVYLTYVSADCSAFKSFIVDKKSALSILQSRIIVSDITSDLVVRITSPGHVFPAKGDIPARTSYGTNCMTPYHNAYALEQYPKCTSSKQLLELLKATALSVNLLHKRDGTPADFAPFKGQDVVASFRTFTTKKGVNAIAIDRIFPKQVKTGTKFSFVIIDEKEDAKTANAKEETPGA